MTIYDIGFPDEALSECQEVIHDTLSCIWRRDFPRPMPGAR